MDKCVNAKYRFGLTGTLDGTETNKLVLEGLFGPTFTVTRTVELQKTKEPCRVGHLYSLVAIPQRYLPHDEGQELSR